MTTTVLQGLQFTDTADGNNVNAVSVATAKLITTDAYKMAYAYAENDLGGSRLVNISEPTGHSYRILLNGAYFDGQNSEATVAEVTWASGKTSQVLFLDTNPADDTYTIFQLGGDKLPTMTSVSQANAFINSVTMVDGTFGGTFGPNKGFTLQSLTSHLSSTQNDVLVAKAGYDNWTGMDINTGLGNDRVVGLGFNEHLTLGSGADTGVGGGGNDTILGGTGNDSLLGGLGADTLNGGDNADRLFGGSGADYLSGGLGGDRLEGGTGNDALRGGGGVDAFVFSNGKAMDRVLDFTDNTDTLMLNHDLGVTSVAGALAKAVQDGANVVFTFGDGDILTVLNATKSHLADDITIL